MKKYYLHNNVIARYDAIYLRIMIIACLIGLFSCKDLDEMNINPNGVDPAKGDVSLLINTVIVSSGATARDLGFGDIAGVMQHTQKDGWAGGHNSYDWNTRDWSYDVLRNAEEMLRKAEEADNDFYAGVAKLFMAYNYGMITDLWGDAPFSEALQGNTGNKKPKFDQQRDIYLGVLAYLEEANTLLSKNQNDYAINMSQDVLYGGNVAKWQKFANSLALRYYLRISEKEPAISENGIRKILSNPTLYPLILDAADDAAFVYPGVNSGTAWPTNLVYNADLTNWRRYKMCSTLVEPMRAMNDPRIAVWANKVEIPLVLDTNREPNFDQIIDGKRVIGQGVADEFLAVFEAPLCYNDDYVGYPPSWSEIMYAYNLLDITQAEQAPYHPHVSHISDLYQKATDPLLKARIVSAAEIHFSLAEIALKGWGGNAEEHYYAGIKASFEVWGVSEGYNAYIATPGVVFNNTLTQIMEQKWIASWSAATEAWFDWRRTGFPALQPGKKNVKRDAIPLRFYYGDNELNYNSDNVKEAIERLQLTNFSIEEEGKNSAWSKMWLLQDTNKPW